MQEDRVRGRKERRKFAGLVIILGIAMVVEMTVGGTIGLAVSIAVVTYSLLLLLNGATPDGEDEED